MTVARQSTKQRLWLFNQNKQILIIHSLLKCKGHQLWNSVRFTSNTTSYCGLPIAVSVNAACLSEIRSIPPVSQHSLLLLLEEAHTLELRSQTELWMYFSYKYLTRKKIRITKNVSH